MDITVTKIQKSDGSLISSVKLSNGTEIYHNGYCYIGSGGSRNIAGVTQLVEQVGQGYYCLKALASIEGLSQYSLPGGISFLPSLKVTLCLPTLNKEIESLSNGVNCSPQYMTSRINYMDCDNCGNYNPANNYLCANLNFCWNFCTQLTSSERYCLYQAGQSASCILFYKGKDLIRTLNIPTTCFCCTYRAYDFIDLLTSGTVLTICPTFNYASTIIDCSDTPSVGSYDCVCMLSLIATGAAWYSGSDLCASLTSCSGLINMKGMILCDLNSSCGRYTWQTNCSCNYYQRYAINYRSGTYVCYCVINANSLMSGSGNSNCSKIGSYCYGIYPACAVYSTIYACICVCDSVLNCCKCLCVPLAMSHLWICSNSTKYPLYGASITCLQNNVEACVADSNWACNPSTSFFSCIKVQK